jgi:transposase
VDTDDEGSTLRKGVHVDPQHKTRRQFSRQFKAETIALIRSSGKSVPHVCRDLDLAESVVRRWLAQAEIDDGRREGLTTVEREELTRLRRENRVLREEREILKKAATFFARERPDELLSVHRRAEGQLLGRPAMWCARGLNERLLRLGTPPAQPANTP